MRAPILTETAICIAGRTGVALRHMLCVTCACRYSIWVAIFADNRNDVAVENLTSAFLTSMLTSTMIYLVDIPDWTTHAPSAIQTSSRFKRKSSDGTDRPRHLCCHRKKTLLVNFASFSFLDSRKAQVARKLSNNCPRTDQIFLVGCERATFPPRRPKASASVCPATPL